MCFLWYYYIKKEVIMNKESKTSSLIVGLILLILVVSGLTYAWLSWQKETTISGVSKCFNINYTKGETINEDLFQVDTPISGNNITYTYGMASSIFTISLDQSCETTGTFTLTLKSTTLPDVYTTGDSKNALKYALVEASTLNPGTSYAVLSKGDINTTSDISLLTQNLSKTEEKKYALIVYVDGNLTTTNAEGASYVGYVVADATQVS